MGASGAMSNGTILARVGSAAVAMVAAAMQRPVIICCETLKFVDRVQVPDLTDGCFWSGNKMRSGVGFEQNIYCMATSYHDVVVTPPPFPLAPCKSSNMRNVTSIDGGAKKGPTLVSSGVSR